MLGTIEGGRLFIVQPLCLLLEEATHATELYKLLLIRKVVISKVSDVLTAFYVRRQARAGVAGVLANICVLQTFAFWGHLRFSPIFVFCQHLCFKDFCVLVTFAF